MSNAPRPLSLWIACSPLLVAPQDAFVHWETPHVSPLALAADGNLLFAVSTADIGRFNAFVQNSGALGSFTLVVDMTSLPVNPPVAIAPGDTWNFQAWFRDVGGTSNLTDGVAATFL